MPVSIHGKEYKTVAERVNEFRGLGECQNYGIETSLIHIDELSVVVKAEIKDVEGRVIASDYAEEVRANGKINATSALENCSTSAIGRALAAFGLAGTEYASANEVSQAVIQQAVKESTDVMIAYNEAVRSLWQSIAAVKYSLLMEDYSSAYEAYAELTNEEKESLHLAPSKGGIFTTKERKQMQSNEWAEARNLEK